jgi:hypothetical protein
LDDGKLSLDEINAVFDKVGKQPAKSAEPEVVEAPAEYASESTEQQAL